eukprot:CAMPEP_0116016460 /NCGR_PEP_ID=MMETSP0321-20121206/7496_1 /TAXON_ID=163516 /ORGANISM="Leptocylindrus danicus var. danicus, Strain B650" /LENGTH=803 /DNA_ID=CAMNT_0003486527 /DNA_START=53 /DNA_END=2464 /DNA_ORIENTATION=+
MSSPAAEVLPKAENLEKVPAVDTEQAVSSGESEGKDLVKEKLSTESIVTPSPQDVDIVTADEVNSQESSSQDDPEEKLLQTLEDGDVEEEKKDDGEPVQAPTLIRAAVASGSVPDGSPEKSAALANSETQKTNQLDFLLSKASEYSSFIAADLEELQESMAAQAAAKEAADGKGKRKKGAGKKGIKKQKTGETSSKLMAQAQAKADMKRPIFIQPKNLAKGCILKDYQLEGVRWLASLYENGVSGILADEMGLGKTIQVIALIAHLLQMKVLGPFLIVAPLATLPNWVREIEKWLPGASVIRYHGNAEEREAYLKGPLDAKLRKRPDFPIIVTSYEVAIRDQRRLNRIGDFTYLVVDEGQRLKNHRCTLIKSLKQITSSNRLLLSGTPISNTLDELWSLLNFVNPQIFDDLNVFQSWFGFKGIGQQTKEDEVLEAQRRDQTVTKLHSILRPFLLRRMKKDVLKDMPPKKEVVVYAGMSKLQLGYMDQIEAGTLKEMLLAQGIETGKSLSQTNKMMNHRKNANHPFLFGEPIDPNTGIHMGTAHPQLLIRASGKFALLDRMLTSLHNDGHQVLVFSQMTAVLNIMEDYLLWRKWNYCRIDGTTKIDERQRQMDVFNAEKTGGADGKRNTSDDRTFVFLLSTRAGGLGINLTAADTCIIFDSDWNPHQDSQAMDRCHRIGQTNPVAVYRLLTAGSVDIEMMEKQISKKKLERMAITGGDFRKAGRRSKGEFSAKDLSTLLQDDIKDLQARGGDVEHVMIDGDEFDGIMNRKKLFSQGTFAVKSEGKMYDIIDAEKDVCVLGSMNG